MVQSYVMGTLNDAQTSEFEEFFLSDPEVAEQVESAQLLRAGLQEMDRNEVQISEATSDANAKIKGQTVRDTNKSLFEKLIGLISIPVPAFAVIAMAAIMSPLALQGLSGSKPNSEINLISFSTDATRSASNSVSVYLSDTYGSSAVLIKLKTIDFPIYKLKLISIGDNDPVWESEPFQPSPLRDKLVSLPSNIFGEFYVEVVGINDKSQEQTVEFCHYSETCK